MLNHYSGIFTGHPASITVPANTSVSFNCTIEAKTKARCAPDELIMMWVICDIASGDECNRVPAANHMEPCHGKSKTAVYDTISSNTTVVQCLAHQVDSNKTYYSKLAILLVEQPTALSDSPGSGDSHNGTDY